MDGPSVLGCSGMFLMTLSSALELNRDLSNSQVPHKSGCVLSVRIVAEQSPLPCAVWEALLHAQQARVCCSSDESLVIPFAFPAEVLALSVSSLNSRVLL